MTTGIEAIHQKLRDGRSINASEALIYARHHITPYQHHQKPSEDSPL